MSRNILILLHVILFLNHQCNLRCTYCYNGEKFQRPMSAEVARKGVDLAFSRGDARLSFFGGEPLMGFDTMKVAVEYALEKDAACDTRLRRFSTTVNGTLIDEQMLRFFNQEGFFLVVSLDGTREANDTNRIFPDGGPVTTK